MSAPQLMFTEAVCRRAEAVIERHPELQRVSSSSADLAFVRARGSSSAACFALACERYAHRDCFISKTGTITYGALWQRVTAFAASGVIAHGDRVAICGAPSIDWVVADLACLILGALSVPLATNLSSDEMRAQLEHAGVTTIVCAASHLSVLSHALAGSRACSTVVVMDGAGDTDALRPRRVLAIEELERTADRRTSFVELADDTPVTVMYTSGSTGRAKGVLLTERRWRAQLFTALGWPALPHVQIGYLPHSAIAGRRTVFDTMMHGGLTYFASGVLPFDEVAVAQPTWIPLVPRVSSVLFQQFQSMLVARFGAMPEPDDPRIVPVMAEFGATALGDRLFMIRVGSGSTAPDIVGFLARCFGVSVADSYGQTETGSIAVNGRVYAHVEYKLLDVPELGYTAHGTPPRGELVVRSPEDSPGYLDDPEATAALFDAEGFIKTGDIMEEVAPRVLAWVDRRQAIIKLAQGLFVATTHLETLYVAGSPFIQQIYLYANPRHAFLLAVIVPDPKTRQQSEAEMRRLLRAELERIARAEGLRAHETPRDFIIEREPFSEANQLVLESGKQSPRGLRARYGAQLDALHAQIAARQLADPDVAPGDVASSIRATLAMVLGLGTPELAAAPSVSFAGFGGDSVTALRFCALVEDRFGVAVPVARVLDPSSTIAATIDQVVALIERGRETLAFDDVHAAGATVVRASELGRLLDTIVPSVGDRAARGTLLTGATGFLGVLLAVELARRAPVHCVVRGPDNRAAEERLRRVFAGAGLASWFDESSALGRIAVVAGDLQRPDLGLSPQARDALLARIDAIVHNGALVNHAMSYRDLFEPNVLGTLEVARLAVRRPGIAVHFISTIGVATRASPGDPVRETERASALWPERPIGGDHAVGYATSKWASEVLLEQLHERHGVGVNIVRCANIAPHPAYPTHVNWADTTNRLLYGLLATRLAPESFYVPSDSPARHDILPLDTVASSIATIVAGGANGFATFHASSAESEPVSLDSLAAWIESAGIALRRLPHGAWFAAFRDALEQLPAPRRSRSPLAAISRWSTPLARDRLPVATTAYRQAARDVAMLDEVRTHTWVRALVDD